MLYLIDGYNLMHAKGHVAPKGSGKLQHARTRFLDLLAQKLGPVRAALTTVVFDAVRAPAKSNHDDLYKNIKIVFSSDGEDADTCIERLIQAHANPRNLTVVSSDRRLIEAARRRRANAMSADTFWATDLAHEPARKRSAPLTDLDDAAKSNVRPSSDDYRAFAEVDRLLAERADDAFSSQGFAPTPDEVAQIEREIEADDSLKR